MSAIYVAKFESGEIVESADFAEITKAVIETTSPLVSVTREETEPIGKRVARKANEPAEETHRPVDFEIGELVSVRYRGHWYTGKIVNRAISTSNGNAAVGIARDWYVVKTDKPLGVAKYGDPRRVLIGYYEVANRLRKETPKTVETTL